MSYAENFDDQFLKGAFRRVSALYNSANTEWQAQGDIPSGHQSLTNAVDLPSARTEASSYVSGLGYVQITYWTDVTTERSNSLWFLPA